MDTDFSIAGGGSIYILRPNTDEAKAWVEEYIPADAMRWSGGVAIECSYLGAIMDAVQDDGFSVQ